MREAKRIQIIKQLLEQAVEDEELELEELVIDLLGRDPPRVLVVMPRPSLEQ